MLLRITVLPSQIKAGCRSTRDAIGVQSLRPTPHEDSPRKEILNKIAHAIGKIELAHPVQWGLTDWRIGQDRLCRRTCRDFEEGKESRSGGTGRFPQPARNQAQAEFMSVEVTWRIHSLHGSQEKGFATPRTEWRPAVCGNFRPS